MRVLGLLLLGGCQVLFPLEDPPTDISLCGASYDIEQAGSKYFFSPDILTWPEAEVLCDQLARPLKGHLAIANSSTELDFIRTSIPNTTNRGWLGFGRDMTADPTSRESFRDVAGDAMPDFLWATNEPNGMGDERVVTTDKGGENVFDITHTERYAPMCECDGQSPMRFDWEE